MNIKLVVFGLLLERLATIAVTACVIRMQLRVFKRRADSHYRTFRRVLFGLALIVLMGNFVPAFIDAATLLVDLSRNPISFLGLAYSFSNATTALLASIALLVLYVMADRSVNPRRRVGKGDRDLPI